MQHMLYHIISYEIQTGAIPNSVSLILDLLYLTKQKYREGNKYVIPYFYQAGYSEELKTDISRALADLGDNTCIDFKVVNESSKGMSPLTYYVIKTSPKSQLKVIDESLVL